MKVLVVGASSFIARHFIDVAKARFQTVAQSHEEFLAGADSRGCEVVINFAIDPAFYAAPYHPQIDMDIKVAQWAAAQNVHFVMLSSRKVYGQGAPLPVTENQELAPSEQYGRNKACAETEARKATGKKLTIVRGANIFGYELGRRTFFGRALTDLHCHRRIALDESPFARRDFMPVESFAQTLAEIVLRRLPGTYNIGSGRTVPIGQLALWLIKGYGSGELHIVKPEIRDEFLLDTNKLEREIGKPLCAYDLDSYCHSLGQRLINA